jgi:asparagine synthase (glutamine-hydrolysing)
MRIAEHASQLVKVVLTGDGGDELFAGYRRNVAVHYARYFRYVPSSFFGVLGSFNLVPLKRRSNLGYFFRLLRCLRVQTGEQYLFLTSDMLIEEDKKGTWLRQSQQSTEIWLRTLISSNLSPLRQLMNTDIRAYLLSDLLVKMDMATMAFSIEARSPLLDHKLAEYLASLPESYLIHSFRAKAILRDIYRGKLPTDVIRGAKRGFELPLNFALKNSLKPLIMDTLGSTDSKTGEYLSKGFITDLLAEKVLQDRNWGFVVYSLLILELWLRGWK